MHESSKVRSNAYHRLHGTKPAQLRDQLMTELKLTSWSDIVDRCYSPVYIQPGDSLFSGEIFQGFAPPRLPSQKSSPPPAGVSLSQKSGPLSGVECGGAARPTLCADAKPSNSYDNPSSSYDNPSSSQDDGTGPDGYISRCYECGYCRWANEKLVKVMQWHHVSHKKPVGAVDYPEGISSTVVPVGYDYDPYGKYRYVSALGKYSAIYVSDEILARCSCDELMELDYSFEKRWAVLQWRERWMDMEARWRLPIRVFKSFPDILGAKTAIMLLNYWIE